MEPRISGKRGLFQKKRRKRKCKILIHSNRAERRKPTLLRPRPIKHSENLEDIRISLIALELIARAVEAQDKLPAPAENLDSMGLRELQVVSIGNCHRCRPRL